MKIKEYLLDRLKIVFCALLGASFGWTFMDRGNAIYATFILLFTACIFCYRIFLIPLDLLMGKVTEIVYFSTVIGGDKIYFKSKSYCVEWKFYKGKDDSFRLLVPTVYSFDRLQDCPTPTKDKKICIRYWRLSKILLSWAEADQGTVV